MNNYLVVLDGVTVEPQVTEFLQGVRDRVPDACFVLLVPETETVNSATEALDMASTALEALRDAGLAVPEAIVVHSGHVSVLEELRRPGRPYECVLRFTRLGRGIHIQRLTLAGERSRASMAAFAGLEPAKAV